MDDFPGSYGENKKNKEISADSRQKTIENAKKTKEISLILDQYPFIINISMEKGKLERMTSNNYLNISQYGKTMTKTMTISINKDKTITSIVFVTISITK